MADKQKPFVLPSDQKKQAQPSTWEDVAKSAAAGLPTGVLSLLGLPGEAQKAGEWIARQPFAAYERLTGHSPTWQAAQEKVKQEQAKIRPGSLVPTVDTNQVIQGFNKSLKSATGQELYTPKTTAGKLAGAVTSAIPMALTGDEPTAAANLARNLPGVLGSSLGATAASAAVPEDSWLHDPLTIAASLLGGVGASGAQAVARARAAAPTLGPALAGQIRREGSLNPETDLAVLQAFHGSPPTSIKPTTAQVINTPEAHALGNTTAKLAQRELGVNDIARQRRASANASGTPSGLPEEWSHPAPGSGVVSDAPNIFRDIPSESDRQAAVAGAKQAKEAALGNAPSVQADALTKQFGIEPNMQANASADFNSHLNDVYNNAKSAADEAWNKVGNISNLRGPAIISTLKSQIDNGLGAVEKASLGGRNSIIGDLEEQYGMKGADPDVRDAAENMPLSELQNLRSDIGYRSSLNGSPVAIGAAGKVSSYIKSILENPNFYGSKNPAFPELWKDAVAKTRDMKQTFEDNFASGETNRDSLGNQVAGPEGSFDRLVAHPNGPQNIRQIVAEDSPFDTEWTADNFKRWLTGKLTKNGTQPNFSSADVQALYQKPQMAAIIDAVPGASEHVENLYSAAKAQEDNLANVSALHDQNIENVMQQAKAEAGNEALKNQFSAAYASGHPALSSFLNNNKDVLKDIVEPQYHGYLEELHANSNLLTPPKGASEAYSPLLEATSGEGPHSVFENVYGTAPSNAVNAASKVGSIGAGALAVPALGMHGPLAEALGISAGNAESGVVGSTVKNLLGNVTGIKKSTISALEAGERSPSTALEQYQLPPVERPNLGAATANMVGRAGVTAMAQDEGTRKHDESVPPSDNLYYEPDVIYTSNTPSDNYEPDVVYPQAQPHAAGGRIGRASGGAVQKKDVEHLVRKLITRAKRAKHETNKTTEPLLKLSDNAVAKALAVAQKDI